MLVVTRRHATAYKSIYDKDVKTEKRETKDQEPNNLFLWEGKIMHRMA